MIGIDFTIGLIFTIIFGCLFGSFLNVLIWRLPRDESITGRSHCPKCKHELIWLDLIPLVSILMFRAKCRYCKHKISLRYPLIEAITGILFGLAFMHFLPMDLTSALVFAKALIVIMVCVVVFVIDLEHYLILDKVVFPAGALMILFALGLHQYTNLLAGVVGFLPFWALWAYSKGRWMGFGDAKFAAFMGFALGLPSLVAAFFLAFGVGAVIGILLIFAGKKHLSSKLPFGTFLSLATLIALFFGPSLWNLYISLVYL